MFKGTKGRVEFRPHFLAGALASGAWMAGCVGTPAVDDDGSVEVPDPSKCPSAAPTEKASCEGYDVGLVCGKKDPCAEGKQFSCGTDGQWKEVFVSCNPPPLLTECPEVTPTHGASCAEYETGLSCILATCSWGSPPSTIVCGEDSQWKAQYISCNPPPPRPPLTECPTVLPESGTSCAEYETGLSCILELCSWGSPPSTIVCGEGGLWKAQYISCNPPPPPMGGAGGEGGAANAGEGGALAEEL
jgi:hypothetical protein